MIYNYGLSYIIKEKLNSGKDISFLPKGDSMLPLIRGDLDRVYLEKLEVEDLKVGDIVLFPYRDCLVLHRIISIDDGMLKLKGDGNCVVEYCNANEVVAIVKYIERGKIFIYRDSFLWKIYNLLWPKKNFFRRFFLILYKLLKKYYEIIR